MRRPIRPQVGSWMQFGWLRRAGPAITNSESGCYRAVGKHLAALSMTDLQKGAIVQSQAP